MPSRCPYPAIYSRGTLSSTPLEILFSIRILTRVQVAHLVFYAYTAGVYLESGMKPIQRWMDQLILHLDGQNFRPTPRPLASPLDTHAPPFKKAKIEPQSPVPIFFASQPPISPKPPNPLAPAQPDLPFLPFFNQAASNRRVKVEYPAEFLGPVHAGQWTVKCVGKPDHGQLHHDEVDGLRELYSEWVTERRVYRWD